jgi:DNA-directed RNA polymerase subunit H (RpoH/RPB5)
MQKLFDIKKTQLEMIKDRGYPLGDEEQILKMDLLSFESYYRELGEKAKVLNRTLMNRFYDIEENGVITSRALVYYGAKTDSTQKQIPASVVREFVSYVHTYGVTEAILIIDLNLSSTGNETLSKLTTVKWQKFNDSELISNPTKHMDASRHVLLSHKEKTEALSRMKTTISGLPLIKVDDPIAKYYNWPVGGLVKIYRNDQSLSILAPESIAYRSIVSI